MRLQEARYRMGFFEWPLNEDQWKEWRAKGVVGTPAPGWVPATVVPPGRTDFPQGFIAGWRKLKQEPKPVLLSDKDALKLLEQMYGPHIQAQKVSYSSEIESSILSLLSGSKNPLSRFDINHSLASDFGATEVSRTLDRLVRSGSVRPKRVYNKGSGYVTVYQR